MKGSQARIFNVGSEDANSSRIAEIVVEEVGLRNAKLRFTGGVKGVNGRKRWKGDVKKACKLFTAEVVRVETKA